MSLILPHKRMSMEIEGRYVYIRACSAPVLITFYPSNDQIKLGFGETYDIGRNEPTKQFTRLDVYNTSSANNSVEIEAGFDAFTAASAGVGSSINIASTSLTLPVAIQMPVDINSMPAMSIAPNQSVNVGNFPASFQVSNFPTSFEVSNLPISFEVSNLHDKDPVINGLPDVSFDVTNKTIAAKAGRKGLILQAPETNQGEIVVQGFLRVAAGAVVPFPASNLVTLVGTVGDVLYVGEEL
ncbi:hypothetical protein B9J90_13420 [Vibrio sp. V09_P4A23P171]|uniref:hypothetical protein n=1 Tax=Vibrio sp. V09_P4A23P171 TaxID=1938664 RepID=UPI000B8E4DF1|nr:hypothetical protein [Vibrio sp. V09_P4A23P171]OXX34139.1 hypothetical protein B9J90_13420 [Vibrio sp. V09_P4A23P171]